MGITVVQGSPQSIWCPLLDSTTIYVGGLVGLDSSSFDTEGIQMLPQAAGASNTTNKDIPFGVCIGTNRYTPVFDTTGKCEYITDPGAADAHDGASIDYRMVEGPWAKGDPIAMAHVAVIDCTTVLRAPIYNAAVGTAPTLLTCTSGNTSGLAATTNATQFTPVAGLSTIYCRSGNNAGAYRILDTTSTTVHAWDRAMRSDTVVGDTFVATGLRFQGVAYCQIGATYASYIDASASPATNYFVINVLRLDLSEAGNEYVEFQFTAENFNLTRT